MASIKLDWSRLLGFDQASLSGRGGVHATPRSVKLGSKVGEKNGIKNRIH